MFARFGFFTLVLLLSFLGLCVCCVVSATVLSKDFCFFKEVKETTVMTMGVFVTRHDGRCLRVQWGGGEGGRVGLMR